MERIWDDFDYDPKATLVSTPLARGFREKARRLPGFRPYHDFRPARPRPAGALCQRLSAHRAAAGKERLEGADATHAWVSVWCGPFDGWVGLDPTNKMLVGDDHIILAEGRDYADVSPIDGVILSSGGQDVEVGVDVIPVTSEDAPPTFG